MLDGLHEANTTAAFEHHYSQQVVAKGKKNTNSKQYTLNKNKHDYKTVLAKCII